MTIASLRKATRDDIPALCELVNSAYRGDSSREGWTTEAELLGGQRTDPESLRALLDAPENVILVHAKHRELLACVFLKRRTGDGTAYLGMLTVKPTLQAKGLGRALLAAAEQWARHNWKVHRMEMTVINKRKELLAWYERRGYRQTSRTEPFPYGDERFGIPKMTDLHFIVFEKDLPT